MAGAQTTTLFKLGAPLVRALFPSTFTFQCVRHTCHQHHFDVTNSVTNPSTVSGVNRYGRLLVANPNLAFRIVTGLHGSVHARVLRSEAAHTND